MNKTTRFDAVDYLQDEQDIAIYLEEAAKQAHAENDTGILLDAISVAFGTYLGAFDEAKGTALVGSDIRMARVRETSSNEMEYAPRGAEIEACGFVPLVPVNRLVDGNAPITWNAFPGRIPALCPAQLKRYRYCR